MRWIVLSIFLAGCSLARINNPPRAGYAQVTVAKQSDGKPSIYIFGINSKHHFVTQKLRRETNLALTTLTLKPGTHSVEIECQRPGAGVVVDGGIDFEISVHADAAYVLDCLPTKNEEHDHAESNFTFAQQLN
jgi:hypothetical protein